MTKHILCINCSEPIFFGRGRGDSWKKYEKIYEPPETWRHVYNGDVICRIPVVATPPGEFHSKALLEAEKINAYSSTEEGIAFYEMLNRGA